MRGSSDERTYPAQARPASIAPSRSCQLTSIPTPMRGGRSIENQEQVESV